MNVNAPDYKEHQKEFFNQKHFLKKNSLSFIRENYTLSIGLYVKLMRSYLFILK